MNIREKVARAICEADMTAPEPNDKIYIGMKTAKAWEGRKEMATAAITAFLEAAAEPGWHIRPDEATEEMIVTGRIRTKIRPREIVEAYRAMLAAAPEFEWDK